MYDSKADMGNRAKALYKMLRIRNELFRKLGITQIYINQLRTKLNAGFGQDPNTTPGGQAMQFYASIRLAFFGGRTITTKIKGRERKVGRYVTIRVIKNKVAPPRATISKAPMYFYPKYHEVGFDRCFGLEDVLVENGIIENKRGTYIFKDSTLCRGEEKFMKLLEEDDELRRKLLKLGDINTIGTTKKKLAKISENLFPVDEDTEYESQQDVEDEDEEEEI